jgi:hypothetical protein
VRGLALTIYGVLLFGGWDAEAGKGEMVGFEGFLGKKGKKGRLRWWSRSQFDSIKKVRVKGVVSSGVQEVGKVVVTVDSFRMPERKKEL